MAWTLQKKKYINLKSLLEFRQLYNNFRYLLYKRTWGISKLSERESMPSHSPTVKIKFKMNYLLNKLSNGNPLFAKTDTASSRTSLPALSTHCALTLNWRDGQSKKA